MKRIYESLNLFYLNLKLMIYKINKESDELLERILTLQKESYAFECNLINFKVPPINENLIDFKSKDDQYYVYEYNGEIIGVCVIELVDRKIEISKLFVAPNYFNKGVATSLLHFIESFCKLQNFSLLVVHTALLNVNAISLYLKFGFRPIEIFQVEEQLSMIQFSKSIVRDLSIV